MLTTSEIKRFIDDDMTSEKKRKAAEGQRYYEAEHDILKSRLFYYDTDGNLQEDKFRSNIRIPHPFFTELSDQLSAHITSFEENPIRAKETAEGLQKHLDVYFDEEFWSEIYELIGGAYNKGFEYLYAYKNAENRLAFECADSMGVVEVRAKDTDDGCKYVIYWYIDRIEKGKKAVKRIQVWSEKETGYYVQVGNGKIQKDISVEVNPRPHVVYTDGKTNEKMGYGLGFIPFYRLDNNRKQFSGLKPIKHLIDDYDLMMCGLSNNLADFDTPLHVVTGFQGDNLDELQTNLKSKKIVGVDSEGGIEIKTVDIPYQARQAKAAEDEKNIYRFGMGLNTNGLKDTSATTNIAIKMAYTLLELKAHKMKTCLKKLLKQLLKVVLAEINEKNKTDYQINDVYFDFQTNIMANETENIQNAKTEAETKQIQINTVLNVATVIGDKEVLRMVCEQLELDFDAVQTALKKAQEENDLAGAKAALESVVIADE